jgi:hypothetical protein
MRLNKQHLVYFLLILLFAGCIEPFSPNLQGEDENSYVVSGAVTNKEGYQVVSLTKGAPIDQPLHIPVSGATLSIEDDQGHVFNMEEFAGGQYRVWINQEFLHAGISFRLHIILSNGEEILSDYDLMHASPEVDSIYYERLKMISPVSGANVEAVQFYTDFHGSETDSRYYRWSAVETWEHHSPWPIQYFYDGALHVVDPWDYSLSVCWITEPAAQVYTLSTVNMVTNDFFRLPILYVDNSSARLLFGYSVLITQHALSEAAYNYWEQLRINNDRRGGLYEKQPLPVTGNLKNLSNPGKKVLGFFEASGTSEKRIFIPPISDMGIYYDAICSPHIIGRRGWREYTRADYPVYLVLYEGSRLVVDSECVDCRYYGGVLEKPEFWPVNPVISNR